MKKTISKSTQTYSQPCLAFRIEAFAKLNNGFKPLTSFARSTILDVWLGSEYASRLYT